MVFKSFPADSKEFVVVYNNVFGLRQKDGRIAMNSLRSMRSFALGGVQPTIDLFNELVSGRVTLVLFHNRTQPIPYSAPIAGCTRGKDIERETMVAV